MREENLGKDGTLTGEILRAASNDKSLLRWKREMILLGVGRSAGRDAVHPEQRKEAGDKV